MRKTVICIPVYLRQESDMKYLKDAIDSVYRTVPPDEAAIMLVDDYSPIRPTQKELWELLWKDGYYKYTTQHCENGGFAHSVNSGMRLAEQEGWDCVLMNSDVKLTTPGWLQHMRDGRGGVTGAKLLFPNGYIQHAGIYFSVLVRDFDHIYRFAPGDLPEANVPRACPVTAALMHISHETISSVGMFDEKFYNGWEDVDYCIRAHQNGFPCTYDPSIVAIHYESMFRDNLDETKMQKRNASWNYLWQKHQGTDFNGLFPTMLSPGENVLESLSDPMKGE